MADIKKEKAVIEEQNYYTYRKLSIEINEDPQQDGPLGVEGMGDGRQPGVMSTSG